MLKYGLGSDIKEGTIIAVTGNKVSSKEKHEKYYNGKWYDDNKQAMDAWEYFKAMASNSFKITVEEKYYSSTDVTRLELLVGMAL